MEDTRERSRSRSRSPPDEGGKEERRYGGNRKGRGGRRRNRPHVGTQHHPGSGGPFGPPGFFPTAYASNYPGGGTHPSGWPGPTPQEGYVNETNTTQTMQPTCARARDPTRGGKKKQRRRRMGPWHACVPRRRTHGRTGTCSVPSHWKTRWRNAHERQQRHVQALFQGCPD